MAVQKNFVVKNGLEVGDSASITGVLVASGITYPTSDGSANQALITDGAGNLTLQTVNYNNLSNTPNVLDSADVLAAVTADGFTKYDSANASGQITAAINSLIDGAPTALDTLNELAAALNDDSNFAGTITAQIAALPDSAEVSLIIAADVDKAFVDALNVNADTLDTQDGTYYLDYTNFTNTPNVLDSADVLATVSAGGYATQTYVDNAVEALPDSAQVSLIITADVDKTFVDALNVDADTLDGQDGTYYLDYTNFTNTPAAGLDSAAVTTIAEDVSLALAIALG